MVLLLNKRNRSSLSDENIRIRLRTRLTDKIENLMLTRKTCATFIFLTIYALFDKYEILFSTVICSNRMLSFYQWNK